MSEYPQLSQQRAFHCPECNGRIVIPANLPATTGPCPHCKATITSPEPDIHSSIIDVELAPVVESSPAPVVAPAPVPTPAPVAAPAPVPTPAAVEIKSEQPAEDEKHYVHEKASKSTKRTSPVLLIVVFFFLVIGLAGGAYFVMNMLKSKSPSNTLNTIQQPKKPAINPTLMKYLAASTLDEKLKYVYNAEELRPKIEAFYKERPVYEAETPASSFAFVKLPVIDSKKGYVLFSYNQPATAAPKSDPASNPVTQRDKILAFIKDTEKGQKIDWEIFTQTKYRTFNHFIKTPVIGKSEVFRLIVSIKPKEESTASYRFADPVHFGDAVEIMVDPKSQSGQALSRLDLESAKQVDANRTATVELIWAGDPQKPQLEIKRFICWEFLNLGGKEIAEINPSN